MGYFIQGHASKDSADMGLTSAFRVVSQGHVGQILLCNWSNQRLQRAAWHYKHGETGPGWGPFQFELYGLSEPPCLLMNRPLFGVTGQTEMKWPDWPQYITMKGREQQENKWKETAFLYLWRQFQSFVSCLHAQVLIPQATGKFDCQIPGIRNVTDQETFGLGWKNTLKSLRRLKVKYSTFFKPPMTT